MIAGKLFTATISVLYARCFVDNCRRKILKQPLQSSHVNQEEFIKAENTLWRLAQQAEFPEEMFQLQQAKEGRKTKLDKTSRIYKLSPFIDEAGVARMDTRIAEAVFVSYNTKFPIIFPKGHRLANLVIEWYRRYYLHANNETVINEVRQRFHIPCLRTLVRNLSKTCMQCRVMKAKPTYPREAPLPEARLSPHIRTFSFVGLDYFGPILVKVGRSLVKRWVALFTCLTIRAVHLEVVHSLSTEACKMAIRRFVVRRGAPLEIRSDNGTNFIGANRELQQQIKEMNQQLSEVFTNAVTKWVFNPPSAPHMGGSWERLQGVTQPPIPIPERPESLRPSWRLATNLVNQFWSRWIEEYLPIIASRTKWYEEAKEPKVGDLAVIVDASVRNGWLRGRIISVIKGRDGRIRQVLVKTSGGVLRRPVTKVAV
ncbi:uncharacterized protein LOC134209824 [Armigeres subalbatus]|uniref:uncharacterized protein LOC134209824 n=1 Tax=Armigeres subalbatus TaxID=124917 RepID=UPI002ED4D8F8